jgi:hypothetical protein
MVSVKVDVGKRDFVWIGLIVVLLGVGFVVAYNVDMGAGDAVTIGHSAGEMNVDLDGDGVKDKSLQEAITDGDFAGGSSVSLSGCYWTAWDANCVSRWKNSQWHDYVATQSISCGASEVMVGVDIKKLMISKSEDDTYCGTTSAGVVPPWAETGDFSLSRRYSCCSLS